jgi:prepilin-type N-terminal cleavage/methylation domain-containing protein
MRARAILRGLHGESERGFTMVELLIVMIVSLVLMAGMVGLVDMGMGQLTKHRALAAVTDSGRRAVSSMARQLKMALWFDDAYCTSTKITFRADIDNDNGEAANVNVPENADKVKFELFGDKVTQTTTGPVTEDPTQTPSNTSLGQYATNLSFYYFDKGVIPHWDGSTYDNALAGNYNASAGMVKIVLRLSKAQVTRTFEQDVFLRILVRSE